MSQLTSSFFVSISMDRDMSKRNLLICFDAFGTLFRPRKPIAKQYGEVARSFGLGGFSDDDVHASFRNGGRRELSKTLCQSIAESL